MFGLGSAAGTRLRLNDGEVIELAVSGRRVIVPFDGDFRRPTLSNLRYFPVILLCLGLEM